MEYVNHCLTVLEYPHLDQINISHRADIIRLIVWLEDRKIRELDIAERESLRQDNELWDAALSNYLDNLGCPFDWDRTQPLECLSWLVSHAIALEYEDIADSYDASAESETVPETESSATAEGPAAETDESELINNINQLGSVLEIPRKSGESDSGHHYLHRQCQKIRLFYSAGAQAALKSATSDNSEDQLTSFPLGFDTQDEVVNRLAIVLKMLHLSEYRELQNDLNALIVLGQEYTANPRTNAGLGKVGR